MSVTTVTELWEERRGRMSADGQREYTRIFRVWTNSNYDDAATVRGALTVALLTSHPEDAGAWASNIDAANDPRHPKVWTARIEYSTRPRRSCDTAGLTDPLLEQPTIVWDFIYFEAPVEKADLVVDKALENLWDQPPGEGELLITNLTPCNSAGAPYDPPLMRDAHRTKLIIVRNESEYDALGADAYNNAINSDRVKVAGMSFKPRQLKLSKIKGEAQYRGSCAPYYRVTYELDVRAKQFGSGQRDWDYEILDQGFYTLAQLTAAGDPKRINNRDNEGDLLSQPLFLDGQGGQLAPKSAPKYRKWAIYDELPFGGLNLPKNPNGEN